MPIPIAVWVAGAVVAAAGTAIANSSSSRSSSGSSRRSETDHDAIKAQRAQEEQKRQERMREDIGQQISQALHSLGCETALTAADAGVLTDAVLLKPTATQPGTELMQQLNQHQLGSQQERQLLGHLMTQKPDKVARLPVLEQELHQLSKSERLCHELEELKAQLAQAGQVNR
jgi:hypothetical protein